MNEQRPTDILNASRNIGNNVLADLTAPLVVSKARALLAEATGLLLEAREDAEKAQRWNEYTAAVQRARETGRDVDIDASAEAERQYRRVMDNRSSADILRAAIANLEPIANNQASDDTLRALAEALKPYLE